MSKKITNKKTETKESMGADSSGSFEPSLGSTILKKDIHKIPNFKTKESELDEITGSGVSAGAMYDAPIGHGDKDPLKIDNPKTAFKNTPTFKNKNLRFGGSKGKVVVPKEKCKKFPYCNQGNTGALEFFENTQVKTAIENVSKKYGIPIDEVKGVFHKRINEGIEDLFRDNDANEKALSSMVRANRMSRGIFSNEDETYTLETVEPLSIETKDEVEVYKLKRLLEKFDVKVMLKKKVK